MSTQFVMPEVTYDAAVQRNRAWIRQRVELALLEVPGGSEYIPRPKESAKPKTGRALSLEAAHARISNGEPRAQVAASLGCAESYLMRLLGVAGLRIVPRCMDCKEQIKKGLRCHPCDLKINNARRKERRDAGAAN